MTVFERHAEEIVQHRKDFGLWQRTVSVRGVCQLEKTILDRYRRVVRLFIQAVPEYPRRPPRVVAKPPIRDQCFSPDGQLNWATTAEGAPVWSEYADSSNPLEQLLDELRRKYHLL